ncbi:MAG: hydantoinase B/oxoprolinase family protein, partial [bacterium]
MEVVRGGLTYAAEEMGLALRNAAYSPNIRERMDHSCTLFDKEGRLVAQAEHIPVHLGSMALALQRGLEAFGEDLREGDQLIFNDPYLSGTHLPDVTLIAPIFYEGEPLGYAANKAHHSDVGGSAPGSLAASATSLYEEGLILPPLLLLRRDRFNETLLRLFSQNVRAPVVTRGDLRAQIAANRLGIQRLQALCARYGRRKLEEAAQEILNHSERKLRSAIRQMPRGTYTADDYLESTGTSEQRVRLRVRIEVTDQLLHFDYHGTDRQVTGPVNAAYGVTLAGVYFVLKALVDPELPMNEGAFRAVTVQVPEGTLLNPRRPAAVGAGNVETSQRNVDVLLRAFGQIWPERVPAASQGTMNNLALGGADPVTGDSWAYYETHGGGYGARPGLDGENGIHSHMTNTLNTPIEALERTIPVRVHYYGLRPDTGGAGEWRGGLGIEKDIELLAPTAIVTLLGERRELAPWGASGGRPGARSGYYLIDRRGRARKLASKCTMSVMRGERIVLRTPGGGGYGRPNRRAPARVAADIEDGYISPGYARRMYHVR